MSATAPSNFSLKSANSSFSESPSSKKRKEHVWSFDMARNLRIAGALVLSLIACLRTWSQPAAFLPPAPGTPVVPLEIPAHVPPALPSTEKPPARRILNTTDAQIEYRYGAVGPSGVSKVEIFVTADRGLSWVKFG